MQSTISIKNLTKKFGKQKAVSDLSFEVAPGEICAFLGSNGSGKTTTIRCLLDIYKPDKGELLIKGEKYNSDLNKFIGYLPEERGLYSRAKVIELFNYFLELRGLDGERENLIREYLTKVSLWEHRDKKVNKLSSGMQQKVQIGLAIIHKPEILILDEPFKGLDAINRQLFIDMFKELRTEGTTILYSTHVIDEAQKMADKIVIIKEGKRKVYGKVGEVRKSFGKDNIHIEFDGNLEPETSFYRSRIQGKTAELMPKKGVNPQEILNLLVQKDLVLYDYKVDYPSLNDIFIRVNNEEV